MKRQSITVNLTSPWQLVGNKAVAPVIIMVEGVHHGSRGPIFWPAHVLRDNASKWEGTPVVINHPVRNGEPISVKEAPDEIIGKVTQPQYDNSKKGIKAKIEIPSNHNRLTEIQSVKEVSAGVFSEETETYGTYNDNEYYMSSIAMEPDHLALLPNERGACSWADGCGIRTNSRLKELATQAGEIMINNVNKEVEMDTLQDMGLFPPNGVEKPKENKDEKGLKTLQAEAEKQGILLPTAYNKVEENENEGDDGLLLPNVK
ncbi:MAG: hypothetical protein K9I68_00330 [Bacteroidales bacterium]|nr:hypothetical protein [Bacteroidales bacterium]MCF8336425.1 hypothetical protein [Bacteroidales bacterium]